MQTTMQSRSAKVASSPAVCPAAPVVPARVVRAAAVAPPPSGAAQALTYKMAGVDIDAGEELVNRIKKMNPNMNTGFNGYVPFGDSYLVSGTDGVGTKLKLAFDMDKHDTVGIDLVAMSVNDVVCAGAQPLFFLDYFATGKLNVDQAEQVIKGIIEGCNQTGCILMGGETAEMPGFYQKGEYDLAGFAVGAVKKEKLIDGKKIKAGDKVLALKSSGVHSNGFSLVRKVLEVSNTSLHAKCPWDATKSIGEVLLTPTTIFVKKVVELNEKVGLKGLVHITGGGMTENIPRVIPKGLGVKVSLGSYKVPELFQWLQKAGNVPSEDMLRTFNMGVGMIMVVDPENVAAVQKLAPDAWVLGEVAPGDGVTYV